MAWSSTPVASDSAGAAFGASSVTTAGVDTTGADFIVLSVGWNGTGTPTVSDSKSNTWNALTAHVNSANETNQLYWSRPTSVGASHTFTVSLAGASIEMLAFSGSATSPFDVQTGATSTTRPLSTGNITPTQDNELIVTSETYAGNFGNPVTVSSGYSTPIQVDFVGSTHEGSSIAYKIQTTATTTDATWDTQFDTNLAVSIASFKAGAGGGGFDPSTVPWPAQTVPDATLAVVGF
jgi:hypothetical protein